MTVDDYDYPTPTARRTDPSTSWMAAAKATRRMATHREKALAALLEAGPDGLNDFQLAEKTGVAQTSIGVRRHDLVIVGLVVPRMVVKDGELVQDQRIDSVPSRSPSLVWCHHTCVT
jgi:hypothetical protein